MNNNGSYHGVKYFGQLETVMETETEIKCETCPYIQTETLY